MPRIHPLSALLLAITTFSSLSLAEPSPTIFGIRIVDAPARPSYGAPQASYGGGPPNILDGVSSLKAGALRGAGSALRFKVGGKSDFTSSFFSRATFSTAAQMLSTRRQTRCHHPRASRSGRTNCEDRPSSPSSSSRSSSTLVG